MHISQRIQALKPSATLAITQRAAELRAAGRDVIGLGAGEPDFDTPEGPRQAGLEAIRQGHTRYTPVAGIPALREAVAEKFRRDQGLDCSAAQVIVSNGAKQCLFNAVMAVTDPGQGVLVPAPYWVSYPAICHLAGAVPRVVATSSEDGFKLGPAALAQALEEHPDLRALLFNSPSNPTGAVYSRDEIAALGEVLERHPQVWIITDEIYEELVYGEARHHSLATVCPALRERTVLVNGLSKSFAMTGWRVGYAAGPPAVIKAMEKVQSHTTSNASSISQYAALGALTGDRAAVAMMRDTFARRRATVLEALGAIPQLRLQPPDGAFYLFPDVSAVLGRAVTGSTELCQRILEQAEVALVPGAAFGEDRCVRLSYAASDHMLAQAMERLQQFFARLDA